MATWDIRLANRVHSYQLPERVFALAVAGHRGWRGRERLLFIEGRLIGAMERPIVSIVVVVGTAGRDVMIYDLRMDKDPPLEQHRGKGGERKRREFNRVFEESSLKFQTRAIACNPNGLGYALSSIDGRVGTHVHSHTLTHSHKLMHSFIYSPLWWRACTQLFSSIFFIFGARSLFSFHSCRIL